MAVTRASIIKGFHDESRLSGDKRVASDYSLQIDGYEDQWLYCKSQFWPLLTAGEGIEVPTAMGSAMWQPSQTKFHQQANVTFEENAYGSVNAMLVNLLTCRAAEIGYGSGASRFSGWVYYGSPEQFIQRARIRDAFMSAEPVEVDWENRTQLVTIPGTLFYHFYGEYEAGNTDSLC